MKTVPWSAQYFFSALSLLELLFGEKVTKHPGALIKVNASWPVEEQ